MALVTGAGLGIGRAAAVRLAEEGATVVATSRTLAHAQETCEQIAATGGSAADAIVFDVGAAGRADEVVAEVAARHGRIDILVANAGIDLPHAPAVEHDHGRGLG